jgi:hypothetical protein
MVPVPGSGFAQEPDPRIIMHADPKHCFLIQKKEMISLYFAEEECTGKLSLEHNGSVLMWVVVN